MPKGAKFAGSVGSVKPPENATLWKVESNTSTFLLWKSVAYRKSEPFAEAIASPL